jgi:hypothetical protein
VVQAQDSWKAGKKLTLDYGMRFTCDVPPYHRSKAPVQSFPAKDAEGTRMAQNPLTGELFPAAYIGVFVPNSRDPYVGAVTAGAGSFYNPRLQAQPVQYHGNVDSYLTAPGRLAASSFSRVIEPKASRLWAIPPIMWMFDNRQACSGDGYTVVMTGNAILPKSQRTFSRFFDTSVFARPAKGERGRALRCHGQADQRPLRRVHQYTQPAHSATRTACELLMERLP